MKHFLFVYGELKQGGTYYNEYLDNTQYIDNGRVYGLTLRDLKQYPGAIYTSDKYGFINGEIYIINDDILNKIDRLEGDEYIRAEQNIFLLHFSTNIKAWTYLYKQKDLKTTNNWVVLSKRKNNEL